KNVVISIDEEQNIGCIILVLISSLQNIFLLGKKTDGNIIHIGTLIAINICMSIISTSLS
ncbi:MAG: hypothetical protein PHS19_05140, partial [Eubacteriales bacterium]|nr:hypothetical protein [Eubacteriales bacterium]